MRKLLGSILACTQNGKRLLDEAELFKFEMPRATLYFLSIIAQEEFAKGFLLYLVNMRVIPWNANILRATKDHKCKHLICIVLDFLTPDTDTFIERMNKAILERFDLDFPSKVADAINILRYEKIGRWESKHWVWAECPDYDPESVDIAGGKLDVTKQDALYVRLGKDGSVVSTPQEIGEEDAVVEYDRGKRFERFMDEIVQFRTPAGLDYERVKNAFEILFMKKS